VHSAPIIDPTVFRRALGRFGSGVTVITTRGPDGRDHGMTASAFCSLSLDPPLVLVCVNRNNKTHGYLEAHGSFGVSLLAEHQEGLSNRFAGGRVDEAGAWRRWPEGQSTFDDLEFVRGEVSGAPLLNGALTSLDCSLHDAADGGDHTIFIGRVHGARLRSDGVPLRPLLYFAGSYRAMGRDEAEEAMAGLHVPDWFE
jgi:flavin reductase (DIM6/NTAB) family NADH-FMN oxidoreductase RutF